MIVETRMLCPKSWKTLFLFSEHNIPFKQTHITLHDEISNEIKTPKINGKNDLSYIFSNLSKFVKAEDMANLGYIIDEIEGFFLHEIVLPIRFERVIQPLVFRSLSNIEKLNYLRKNLKKNLIHYSKKLESVYWFNQKEFNYLDITMGTAIAVLDYLGEVPWHLDEIKDLYLWYIKIKSRATFKIILNETCPGLKPFTKFTQIDF